MMDDGRLIVIGIVMILTGGAIFIALMAIASILHDIAKELRKVLSGKD